MLSVHGSIHSDLKMYAAPLPYLGVTYITYHHSGCRKPPMKIYEDKHTPNARRVRIFLAEKNIPMEYVQLDVGKGENLRPEFKEKNPLARVPVLELDDGEYLSESAAICRYFELLHPEPPLLGREAREQAEIEMWHRRVEWHLNLPVGMSFQHLTDFFSDRLTPIREWGEVNWKASEDFFGILEKRLACTSFIAGDRISIADIAALCAIDFARVVKLRPDPSLSHLHRWLEGMRSRPSADA